MKRGGEAVKFREEERRWAHLHSLFRARSGWWLDVKDCSRSSAKGDVLDVDEH